MKKSVCFVLFLMLFAFTGIYAQRFVAVHPVETAIEQDLKNNIITYDESILYKFYHLFDRSKLPARYHTEEKYIAKCGTMIFVDYINNKDRLDQKTIDVIEKYLSRENLSSESLIYISPSGKFEFTYDTIGTNAVPKNDQNGNGIPDFVENAALYADYSWYVQIDSLGFTPPPISPPTTRYKISFEAMSYYGYCAIISQSARSTRIVLNNSFLGFPPNTDPDGNQLGAMKVTIAHEFKHASQYRTSRWTESNWVEVDATWAEDIVFDQTNDYYNYLTDSDSPLIAPGNSLDGTGAGGSYEDCIWQHYMSETHGNAIIRDFWIRRGIKLTSETVLTSYDSTFVKYGSSLSTGFRNFTAWNYMTGTRAVAGFGYEEAAYYPTSILCRTHTTFPASGSQCTINHLAANFVHLTPSASDSILTFSFNGQNAIGMALQFVVKNINGTVMHIPVALDANNDANVVLPIRTKNIQHIGLIPVITHRTGTGYTYTYSINRLSGLSAQHTPLSGVQDSTGPYPIQVIIRSYGEPINPAQTKIFYQTDLISDSSNLTQTGGDSLYSGQIPFVGNYTSVRYYLQITDSSGYRITLPANAPSTYYEFSVGADVLPPTLTVLPFNRYPIAREFPLTIHAKITDDSGLDSTYLRWKINSTPMPDIFLTPAQNDTFVALLTADTNALQPGDTIQFSIFATDQSVFRNQKISAEQQIIFVREFTMIKNFSKAIPDNNAAGVSDTLELTATEMLPDQKIVDLDVIFTAIHPLVGDLTISLSRPGGLTKTLMQRPGPGTIGSSGDNPDIILDDEAATSIEDITFTGSQIVTGSYKPFPDTLSAFDGLPAAGQWIMKVSDHRATSTGTWTRWGLRIRSAANSVAVSVPEHSKPTTFTLEQNYPNPFNPTTTIRYTLPESGRVRLSVYNTLGQKVVDLVNTNQPAGFYVAQWNGKDAKGNAVSSGVYIYRLQTDKQVMAKKMILIR